MKTLRRYFKVAVFLGMGAFVVVPFAACTKHYFYDAKTTSRWNGNENSSLLTEVDLFSKSGNRSLKVRVTFENAYPFPIEIPTAGIKLMADNFEAYRKTQYTALELPPYQGRGLLLEYSLPKGLPKHVNYSLVVTQVTRSGGGKKQTLPDVIIHLPLDKRFNLK